MLDLNILKPNRVFYYFNELSQIPRGSGNMEKIADYCVKFAEEHSLNYVRDKANNVIIYKNGTAGRENSEPVILQGHLDMVCQKDEDCRIDFLKDGLELYTEDGFLTAKGTTLGGDNGIAVAMVLAILESDDYCHPPIEAVFTTDEEIGMIGALQLDFKNLKGKRLINIDSEDIDTVTVSCAGGSEFKATLPITRKKVSGTKLTVALKGLLGGHSGIMIDKGRANADILVARVLNHLKKQCEFSILSINGGDKSNAIPPICTMELCCNEPEEFRTVVEEYLALLKAEIAAREPFFYGEINICEQGEFEAISKKSSDTLITALLCVPNGIMEMSAEIEGLVETSLNLGVLKAEQDSIIFCSALRSNKKSALVFLEEKLEAYYKALKFNTSAFGHYPPWEFNSNSTLLEVYKKSFRKQFNTEPKVEAIHAGLECGVFADGIKDFDGISIGPQLYDVHTTAERLDINSTEQCFNILLDILKECK